MQTEAQVSRVSTRRKSRADYLPHLRRNSMAGISKHLFRGPSPMKILAWTIWTNDYLNLNALPTVRIQKVMVRRGSIVSFHLN